MMAYTYPAPPHDQVTYHFDREAALLVSTGYDDYGLVAQTIELGVQLHMATTSGTSSGSDDRCLHWRRGADLIRLASKSPASSSERHHRLEY
ncbi:hypothetical protein MNO14_14410 [Luteimonas sp. S4-F44]|uniref:hypothetical protein n=1 Tax=Luteimonas sp. S4-F44 TaxID=2925842 RepID=UPI001F530D31|nr:hypothetical protein [Luteimonas sp. S4-F44]UNK42121.1 hypothetical protein MNO14_14410 [Luteimonas sp. S4-F44]